MKIIEASNGLMALLVEKSNYDGMWISSLCHATQKGLPDNELVPLKERVDLVAELARISTKPIIVDIDTGGDIEHLPFLIRWFEKAGAYAVIMEDKKYPKQNSLLEEGKKDLEDVDVFAQKIKVAKENTTTMKVFARLESLIAKRSKYEALLRADAYIEAGANGVMVHSKNKVDCREVMEVGNEIRLKHPETTLIAVPTTYDLPEEHPFNVVISANHLTRASLKAMQRVLEIEDPKNLEMASVEDIFNLVGK